MADTEKRERYLNYFDEICVEDQEDVITVCDTASMVFYSRFKFKIDDPKLYGVIFSKTFETILNVLEESTKDHLALNINMVNTEIGYTSVNTETDEKEGNLMFYIRYLYGKKKEGVKDDYDAKSKELCVQWNTENITENPDILRRISARAIEELKKIDVIIGFSDLIIPLFVTTMESLIEFVQIHRKETKKFEYEINFLSCFYISCLETEDGDEISFRPSILSKLKIKNDAIASSI